MYFDLSGAEIRPVEADEIEQASKLEAKGYPEDEAATGEQLEFRQNEAPELFIGCFEGSQLIGFVCGSRHRGPRMKAESMTEHIPDGDCVCIHSVCVEPSRQRQGVAKKLLKAFKENVVKTQEGVVKLQLITKANLIPVYTRAGFTLIGRSLIEHGKDTWHEMEMVI